MKELLNKFPLTKPDRVIEDPISGDTLMEWQQNEKYFEIYKEPDHDVYEIMIEVEPGKFEHWELERTYPR